MPTAELFYRRLLEVAAELRPMFRVADGHYEMVGQALWTLVKALAAAFTPAVRDARTRAYTLLATTMKNAAREVEECVSQL